MVGEVGFYAPPPCTFSYVAQNALLSVNSKTMQILVFGIFSLAT